MKRLWLLCCWALALALWVRPAGAQADAAAVDKAKNYFHAGAQAYAVGQYLAAVQAFEQAWELAPRPAILFSMAQAERRQYFIDRKQEHLERALSLFRQYIEMVPQGGRRVDAVAALSELEPMAAKLTPRTEPVERTPPRPPTRLMVTSSTPGARISLDGRSLGESPMIEETKPGQHEVVVSSPGYFEEKRYLTAVHGELIAVDVTLRERPATLKVIAAAGTHLTIDGRYTGVAPLDRDLELTPGKHIVTFTRSGFVGISREVELGRGDSMWLKPTLPRSQQRKVAMTMLGGSVSALVAGGVFGYFSLHRQHAAQAFLDSQGTEPLTSEDLDQYRSAREERDRLRNVAWGAVGIGVTLAITGGLLYVLDPTMTTAPSPDRTLGKVPVRSRGPSLAATPLWQPGSAGLGFSGAF